MLDRTYKALSLMLSYPAPDWQAVMPEIAGVIDASSQIISPPQRMARAANQ